MRDLVEFEWKIDDDGYELVDIKEHEFKDLPLERFYEELAGFQPNIATKQKPAGQYLRPRGGTTRTTRLLEKEPALFKTFADTPMTPEGVINFANKYGQLDVPARVPGLEQGDPDVALKFWYAAIDYMCELMAANEKKDWSLVEGIEKILRVDTALVKPRGSSMPPQLIYRPKALIDALLLQFALFVMSPEGELQRCVQCVKWFAVGSGTGRRTTAMYCSPECKERAKYLKRKKQKTTHEGT